MDKKNKNMIINKKAEFAVKILLEYAKENGINGRDTTDLSPLEKWLILRLYNVVGRSEQLKALEELKDFAYDNCQPHNNDRLAEIMERL